MVTSQSSQISNSKALQYTHVFPISPHESIHFDFILQYDVDGILEISFRAHADTLSSRIKESKGGLVRIYNGMYPKDPSEPVRLPNASPLLYTEKIAIDEFELMDFTDVNTVDMSKTERRELFLTADQVTLYYVRKICAGPKEVLLR